LPPPQPSPVNALMPLRRFDGEQVPQQYVSSDSTQRVQTTVSDYGIQSMPTLMCDADSLALGCTQTYNAAADTAVESSTGNLQSLAANYGMHGSVMGPSHTSNFLDRNGVPGPCGPSIRPPLWPPLSSYPAVTCECNAMPYTHPQSECIRNLNARNEIHNSNTENNIYSHSVTEHGLHLNLISESNNFVFPSAVSLHQYPIYSTANMTGLGLLHSYPGPCGLPFPVPVGPGAAVTWTSTTTHPVHRESTSSYAFG